MIASRSSGGAVTPPADARGLYLARTYAYVAAGRQGLAIVDIEKPEAPRLDQVYDAKGSLIAVKSTMAAPVVPGIDAARERENACFAELMGTAANSDALAEFNQGKSA